jgi:hypothetical protein
MRRLLSWCRARNIWPEGGNTVYNPAGAALDQTVVYRCAHSLGQGVVAPIRQKWSRHTYGSKVDTGSRGCILENIEEILRLCE